jgi:hypothetical protein
MMNQPALISETINGELTGVALNVPDSLFAPPEHDAFGLNRRPLGLAGMRLSLELARMAYTLDIEPWMRAGWTDFSIQVDNQLTTDMTAKEDKSLADRRLSIIGSLRLTRARRALREHNPLAQVTGAFRQRGESDTIKAVVMMRPAEGGRYVLAIGFMGTGARFYDWFSNLRLGTEDGFHKGFYQLMQAFLKNEEHILFPDTAEALGLKKLTLSDILADMQTGDSRFSLWMAGHSQGAAVMQVYCDYLLRKKKIPRARLIGCGFASPTVAANDTAADRGSSYPLYHVLNADDLVPRMGSLKHFGLCLRYSPDAGFRDLAYGWRQTADDCAARRNAERLTQYITDTPSFLTAFTALLAVVCEEKSDDAIFGGSEGLLSVAPIERAVSFAGKKAKETLGNMMAYMRRSYREILGRDMDEETIVFLKENFRPIVQGTPLKRLMGALYDRLYPPHSLYRTATGNGAYLRIVNERSGRLKPFIWQDDPTGLPHKRYGRDYYTFDRRRPAKPAARRRPRIRRWRRRRAVQGGR